MKVIFLDVDGELTYSDYTNPETANIDPEKVLMLKEICDKTKATVVISSSWRGTAKYTPKIYHTLRRILEEYRVPVFGDLPYIPCEIIGEIPKNVELMLDELCENPQFELKHGTGRAAEVEKFLSENSVESFVILDDEDYDWKNYGMENNWVQPTWFGNGGLKDQHVKQAIGILNRKVR